MFIFNNILDEKILLELNKHLYDLPYFIHGSKDITNFYATENTAEDDFFKKINYAIIEKTSHKFNFTKINIYRSYVNVHNSGQDNGGKWHTDDGTTTFLFYPNKWDVKFKGGTSFIINNEVKILNYVQNQLIVFPAKIEHKAEDHFNFNNLRFTYAIKTDLNLDNLRN